MLTNNKSWRTAGLAIMVGVLAGCGSPAAVSAPAYTRQQATPPVGQQPDQAVDQGQQPGQGQKQDPLGLTQEQQQKLQQIAQKQAPAADQDPNLQRFISLVTADQVDVQALATHLQQERERLKGQIDSIVQSLSETRAILTAEQRAKFAQLQQQPAQAPQQGQDPLAGLNLTAEQKQALESLQPSQQSNVGQAIVQFMTSGDATALKDSFAQDLSNMVDTAKVAQALASLSKEQRQKLFGLDQQQPNP